MVLEQLRALTAEVRNVRYEVYDELAMGAKSVPLPKVMSRAETLQSLIESSCSLARFGDGEVKLLFGRGIEYQEYTSELQRRLRQVILCDDPRVLVGVPALFGSLAELKPRYQDFWREFMSNYRDEIYELLSFDRVYGDTQVSRPYIIYKETQDLEGYFAKVKELWRDRDVVIVEGPQSGVGAGNDLLESAATVRYIYGPPRHAFRNYTAILENALKYPSDVVFLLALGPTATVLAHELTLAGYRALDIGHIDLEYEWYKRGASSKTIIPGKCLAEAGYVNQPSL